MALKNGCRRSGDQSSVASSRSNHSAAMDEAFRRVGHRLSQSVGGDEHSTPIAVANLGGHDRSAFSPKAERDDATIRNHAKLGYNRTAKVAKMRYTDHGTHQELVAGSIIKNLTCHAKETFSTLKTQTQHTLQTKQPPAQAGKKRISPSFSLSPHRQALSELTLDEKSSELAKGLLQAVLDGGNSSSSSTPTVPISHQMKGKCLTQPAEPVSNDGLDNVDGNLIVHVNDHILVPATQVHTLLQGRNKFRVLSLLGQGTFAQVFKCQCLQSGQIVAVKVIKNKPAYTRQAAVEIDIFMTLAGVEKENILQLQCYFMYHHHLCLVFELLGLNLYEVLKQRQFRGLPLQVVRTLVRQALAGLKDLSEKNIVHCDLKPENILLRNEEDVDAVVNAGEERRPSVGSDGETMSSSVGTPTTDDTGRTSAEAFSAADSSQKIKLIDFGSACFEGQAAHTYIQSRFYRSPEVLIGLPYDSAIDMWSMGCVAAELLLGLPILPGAHEHDQLGRICEMIGLLPDRMLEHGSKSTKYFVKELSRSPDTKTKTNTNLPPRTPSPGTGTPPPPKVTWRLKTQLEYIQSLSSSEIRKKGGLAKLQKRPTSRYFQPKKLVDIIMLHGHYTSNEEKEALGLFAHFLMGTLDPDPLKRWTAYQASMHPFITGSTSHRHRSLPQAGDPVTGNREFDIYWAPPWDATICRRKLLDVQRVRDKQRVLRRSLSAGYQPRSLPAGSGGRSLDASPDKFNTIRRGHPASPVVRRTPHMASGMDTIAMNHQGIPETLSRSQGDQLSPPSSIDTTLSYQAYPGGWSPMGAVSASGMMMNNPPHLSYAAFSNLSDYNSGVPFDQRTVMSPAMVPPSMHIPYPDVSMMQGAHSYSGIYGESLRHFPVEADFSYALQRPGVVPGMDLPSSGAMLPQLAGLAYSPLHMPAAHQRSSSFTHSGGGYSQPRRQTRGPHAPNDLISSPGNRDQSQFMHNNLMTSPTSIQEDSTDYVLGGCPGGSVDSWANAPRTSGTSSATCSLLTQQLEGRLAGQQTQQASSYQDRRAPDSSLGIPPSYIGAPPGSYHERRASDSNLGIPPAYIGAPPGSYQERRASDSNLGIPPAYIGAPPGTAVYPQNNGQPVHFDSSGGFFYTTYMTANGVAMAAPVPAQMHAYGSYGSYLDQQILVPYGQPNSLAQAYPPAALYQPRVEETEQNGSFQRLLCSPPYYYNHGVNM